MNLKKIILTAAAVFVAMFVLEFVTHDLMLKEMYRQTASVWRPANQMQSHMGHMVLGYVIYSIFFSIIYAKGYETGKSGVGQGLRFGILMALLQAPFGALIWYSVLPIPAALAVSWMAAGLVLNTSLGLVAGLVYKP